MFDALSPAEVRLLGELEGRILAASGPLPLAADGHRGASDKITS